LVDSLDTLQIMGMEDEYRDALRYVAQVDFAHTRSYNIPIFETVIRYLGGLLGAYDMSDGRDTMLLEKARDLGDMLMGAFDTINRMPLLRYDWRPQAARQNRRASQDSCLAELGTLTLEFTRLAQLTGNHSYFDAVRLLLVLGSDLRCNELRMDSKISNSLMFLDCTPCTSMLQDVDMRRHDRQPPNNNQSTHLQMIKECEPETETHKTMHNRITDNPKATAKRNMTGQALHIHRRSMDKHKEIDNRKTGHHI